MTMPITAVYASLLAILYVILSYRVAQRRMRFQVGLGTGQNTDLERAVRIHGNFAEYVPFALLLLALFETGGGPAWAVHAAGAGLLVARGLHALGLTSVVGAECRPLQRRRHDVADPAGPGDRESGSPPRLTRDRRRGSGCGGDRLQPG